MPLVPFTLFVSFGQDGHLLAHCAGAVAIVLFWPAFHLCPHLSRFSICIILWAATMSSAFCESRRAWPALQSCNSPGASSPPGLVNYSVQPVFISVPASSQCQTPLNAAGCRRSRAAQQPRTVRINAGRSLAALAAAAAATVPLCTAAAAAALPFQTAAAAAQHKLRQVPRHWGGQASRLLQGVVFEPGGRCVLGTSECPISLICKVYCSQRCCLTSKILLSALAICFSICAANRINGEQSQMKCRHRHLAVAVPALCRSHGCPLD